MSTIPLSESWSSVCETPSHHQGVADSSQTKNQSPHCQLQAHQHCCWAITGEALSITSIVATKTTDRIRLTSLCTPFLGLEEIVSVQNIARNRFIAKEAF